MLARRFVAPAARKIASGKVMPKLAPQFSTLLEKKEAGEETRFIKQLEAQREAEIRQNLERIMALEHDHEEKQKLVELLGEKKEEKSLVSTLSDWKFALPLGVIIGIPAILNDVAMIDAEMQMAACFVLFCSTMYTQVGPIAAKAFDDHKKEVANDLKGLDEVFSSEAKALIKQNEQQLDAVQEFKDHNELVDAMASVDAQNRNNKAEHLYREEVIKKLDALHVLEENASAAIRNRTVSAVKTEVVNLFTNDKKAKENALNAAIAVLAAGEGAKLGKDIVGEAFTASLVAYKEKYSKSDPKSDNILTQLEKDVAAIIAPPQQVAAVSSNVHPFGN